VGNLKDTMCIESPGAPRRAEYCDYGAAPQAGHAATELYVVLEMRRSRVSCSDSGTSLETAAIRRKNGCRGAAHDGGAAGRRIGMVGEVEGSQCVAGRNRRRGEQGTCAADMV
jgi:hypothetical protein